MKIKPRKYKSQTDKSHYKPNVNMLNNVIGKNEKDTGMYDFNDGKDDGTRFTTLRDLGADRVEVDNAIERMRAEGEKATEYIKSVYKEEIGKIKNELEKQTKTTETQNAEV